MSEEELGTEIFRRFPLVEVLLELIVYNWRSGPLGKFLVAVFLAALMALAVLAAEVIINVV